MSNFVSYQVPSPIPEFRSTPQENHMAEDKVRASSSSSSLFTLNLPNGLQGKAHLSSSLVLFYVLYIYVPKYVDVSSM